MCALIHECFNEAEYMVKAHRLSSIVAFRHVYDILFLFRVDLGRKIFPINVR